MPYENPFDQYLGSSTFDDVDWTGPDLTSKPARPIETDQARQLTAQVEKLWIVSRALCELLMETTGLTEDAILDRINEVDLRDGSQDGKMKPTPLTCPACNRTVGLGRVKCQYCGETAASEASLDDKI